MDTSISIPGVGSVEAWLAATRWLAHEAELLDERRWEEWLELLSPDITYEMPVRTSRDAGASGEFSTEGGHFSDDHWTLTLRLERLKTEYAWAEDPPTRTRHHVSCVRASQADDGSLSVRSNLLYFRSRGGEDRFDAVISAERRDVLVESGGELLLRERVVLLDHALLPIHNLTGVL
jgi:3-phenylpropionate/cinnamic acid dioxygenase small subunit